jgi:hypothetical protein
LAAFGFPLADRAELFLSQVSLRFGARGDIDDDIVLARVLIGSGEFRYLPKVEA